MKQIRHGYDAVPKSLNALVVCSSNIYITNVNYLPNWKKKKKRSGTQKKKIEATTQFYGLPMPSVMYAKAITQTSNTMNIADNTHGLQEWWSELRLALAHLGSVTAD